MSSPLVARTPLCGYEPRRTPQTSEFDLFHIWMFQGPQDPSFPNSIPRVRFDALGGASACSQLWVPSTGQMVASLKGHTKPVTAVSWSTLGGHAAEEEGVLAPWSVLASASWDGTVRLWERGTDGGTGSWWRCVCTLRDASLRACALYAVAWRPPRELHEAVGVDSTQIASGGADGEHPRHSMRILRHHAEADRSSLGEEPTSLLPKGRTLLLKRYTRRMQPLV